MLTWLDVLNATGLILLAGGLWYLRKYIVELLDGVQAKNRLEHARADRERSLAGRVIPIPGVAHITIFYDGDEEKLISIPPPPATIDNEERLLRDYALIVINQSVEFQNGNGDATQIIPEDKAQGIGHEWWGRATNYMESKGWVVKIDRQKTICNGSITLSVIRRALSQN
jgi:hypothetical protein